MKEFVKFRGVDAIDYHANMLVVCSKAEAEYEIVLQEHDRLKTTDEGVYLVRDGYWYLQIDKMASFRGIAFKNIDDFEGDEVITCKLLKCGAAEKEIKSV